MAYSTIPSMPVFGNSGFPENTKKPGAEYDYVAVSNLARSPYINNGHKLAILSGFPAVELNTLYDEHMAAYGLHQPPLTNALLANANAFAEGPYNPLIDVTDLAPNPRGPLPAYGAYTARFMTSESARAYRKRSRVSPKSNAPDVDRVKRFGRQYWIQRLYESIIDMSEISDGTSSIHRLRFTNGQTFDQIDLEATAHHVFDEALAVHERGWARPIIYHKKVVRGKLADVSENSLETRLARICLCLKQKKAAVDDAMRGGVTLALLCDNPEARGFTKLSNNTGNKKRGERLRFAKDQQREKGK